MTKETYLRFLRAYLTNRLPGGEVEDIMNYYTEYFEEAGEGREQLVMAELGSPEHLARQILGQRGQESLAPLGAESWEPSGARGRSGGGGMPRWLYVLILILAAVTVGPTAAALVFGLGLAGVLCLVIGLWVAVAGLGKLSLGGMLFQMGGGLIAGGTGVLLLLAAVLLAWCVLRLIRWFRDTFVERRDGLEAGY